MLVGRTKVNDGMWHHITVTFSASSRAMSLYIDGSLDATRSDTFRTPNFGSFDFNIGRGGLESVSYFPGAIDDVSVWQRALSSTQVATLASGQSVPLNMVASWNFDNSGSGLMPPNMFASIQQNYIMYCGGAHGHCPSLVLSSAPSKAGPHVFLQLDGWSAVSVAEGSPEPPARHSHAAAAVNGGILLVHGGIDKNNLVLDDLWVGTITPGKIISWSQLFQPQTFRLYAHSLISHYDLPNEDRNQIVTFLSRDPDSECNIDYGACRSFRLAFCV